MKGKAIQSIIGSVLVAASTVVFAAGTTLLPINFQLTNGDTTADAGLSSATFTIPASVSPNYSVIWLGRGDSVALQAANNATSVTPSPPVEIFSPAPVAATLPMNLSVNFANLATSTVIAPLTPQFADATWSLTGTETVHFSADNNAVCYVSYISGDPTTRVAPKANAICYTTLGVPKTRTPVDFILGSTCPNVSVRVTAFDGQVTGANAALLGTVSDSVISPNGITNKLILAGAPLVATGKIPFNFTLNFTNNNPNPAVKTSSVVNPLEKTPVSITSNGRLSNFVVVVNSGLGNVVCNPGGNPVAMTCAMLSVGNAVYVWCGDRVTQRFQELLNAAKYKVQ